MNALARVVESTKKFDTYPAQETLKQKQEALEQRHAKLLPIEADASKAILQELSNVISLRNRLEAFNKFGGVYKPIDMECLRIRDFANLPVLIPFKITDPTFYITAWSERGVNIGLQWNRDSFPPAIAAYYADVRQLLVDRSKKLSSSSFYKKASKVTSKIELRFTGVIPDSTREKIEVAKKEFGNNIFILSEVKCEIKDTSESLPQPIPVDPLVLGWDGNALWLIDQFDITPLEKAVVSA